MRQGDRTIPRSDRIAECARLYSAGWAPALIAAKLDVDIKTIRRYLEDAGLRKVKPQIVAVMQGAIHAEEIETFKKTHKVGDAVKVFRIVGGRKEQAQARIIGVYPHFARTDYGCFRWADLVRYSRNIMEGADDE